MAASNRKIEDQVTYTKEGKLVWTNPRKKSLTGAECGHVTKNGYRAMFCENRRTTAHHVVWYLHHGVWPDTRYDIDHINMDKLDNRIENLRLVPRAVNALNNKALGVSRNGKGWRARVGQKHIGTFQNREDAIIAARKLKEQLIKEGVFCG
jgi:hypothetical protein